MRELIQKTIDILKQRVKNNLEIINTNQRSIKEVLKNKNSVDGSIEFEKYYGINKTMLQENNDYINIQLTLINFLEKYKGTAVLEESLPIVDIYSITDDCEVLDLTLKGVIKFDEKHPRYNDTDFIDLLIKHYQRNEEYERCQALFDMKSKLV
jgi:hypothetical protein